MSNQVNTNSIDVSTSTVNQDPVFTFEIRVTVAGKTESDAATNLIELMDKVVISDEAMISYAHPSNSIPEPRHQGEDFVPENVFSSIAQDLLALYRSSSTEGMASGLVAVDSKMLSSICSRVTSVL